MKYHSIIKNVFREKKKVADHVTMIFDNCTLILVDLTCKTNGLRYHNILIAHLYLLSTWNMAGINIFKSSYYQQWYVEESFIYRRKNCSQFSSTYTNWLENFLATKKIELFDIILGGS